LWFRCVHVCVCIHVNVYILMYDSLIYSCLFVLTYFWFFVYTYIYIYIYVYFFLNYCCVNFIIWVVYVHCICICNVCRHKYIFYFAFICLHVFLLCVFNSLGLSIFTWARFQVIGIDTDKDMIEERTYGRGRWTHNWTFLICTRNVCIHRKHRLVTWMNIETQTLEYGVTIWSTSGPASGSRYTETYYKWSI